ncbi:PQQ-like beta-propeller repeat protein [Idiomarina aquatica]|uniref:Pyrrolo-quinoline quinone repeat domain-containing protein n=1 Tax=Idiomarina aquatica TaxID=1327752 RepID=A0AA94JCL2_9GAMM|nr:PQQ-like beta-propeller repeat protein [Idiomarina aquatica]RUO42589.1 hypothetical protein CWE23_10945 [Idiomarina aquatica]
MKTSLSVCIALVAFLFSHCVSADWLGFKGHQQRNLALNVPVITSPRLAKPLDLPTLTVASPLIHGEQIILGGLDGVIYSFSRDSYRLNWLTPTGAAIRSTPTIVDGTGYVLNEAGKFLAFDTASGKISWEFVTQGESRFTAHGYLGIKADEPITDPWDYFSSSPVIHNELVIFGSSDQHIYALNKTDGSEVWRFKARDLIHSSPAIWGELLIVGGWDGTLLALNLNSGRVVWEFETGKDPDTKIWQGIQASPAVYRDHIYVGSRDGFMYRLDAASGQEVWRYDMARSWVLTTAAVDDEFVYIGSSDTGFAIALNRLTGEEVWRYETGGWNYSSPILFNNAVIFSSALGKVVALQRDTGDELWKLELGALESDTYQVLTQDSKLDSNAHNGTRDSALYGLMHRVLASGGFLASPAWSEGKLYLLSTAGELYVLSERQN